MKCSRGSSIFLKRSPKSFPFYCFPLLLCIDHWGRLSYLSLLFLGTLHSDEYIFSFLFSFASMSRLFSAICKASSDNHFAFLYFFFLSMFLITASSTMSQTSVHCLSDLIPWIYLSLPLYKCRDLIEVIPEWSSGFPYFLQFKSEFGNSEFMIWATGSSRSCFCWLCRASPSLSAKNIINLILVLTIW